MTRTIVDGVAGFILPPDKCCETCDHFKDLSYGLAQYQLGYLREQVVALRKSAYAHRHRHITENPAEHQADLNFAGYMRALQDVINLLGVKAKEIQGGDS